MLYITTLGKLAQAMSLPPKKLLVLLCQKKTYKLTSLSVNFVLLFADNLMVFIIGRTMLGFSYGIQCLMMNIYVAEISSKEIRGAFGSTLYLCSNTGVLFQFIIGALLSLKMVSVVTSLICAAHFLFCWCIVESPYFLVAAKKEEKAQENLTWLRATRRENVVDEFNGIIERVKVKQGLAKSFKSITSQPDCWGFLLCVILSFLSDLTGRVPVMSYATENFKTLAPSNASLFTILLGCFNVLFPFISVLLSDKVGRKALLVVSAFLAMLMHFGTASLYFLSLKIGLEIPGSRWLLFATNTVFLCCCSIYTTNVLTLRGDLLAENSRGLASGFSSMAFGLAATLDIKLFQSIATEYGIYSAFWVLSALGIVYTAFICIFIPETKNKTFEEIQTGLNAKKSSKEH